MGPYVYYDSNTSSTWGSTTTVHATSDGWAFISEDKPKKKEKKNVFKDDIFRVAAEVFDGLGYLVLFTSKAQKRSNDIIALKNSKSVYLYNPNSDGSAECELRSVEGGMIIDCLEYVPSFMQRANIIRHAFSCLRKDGSERPLLVATDGSGDLDESELTKLLYFAGAKSVTKPEALDIYIETPYLLATR